MKQKKIIFMIIIFLIIVILYFIFNPFANNIKIQENMDDAMQYFTFSDFVTAFENAPQTTSQNIITFKNNINDIYAKAQLLYSNFLKNFKEVPDDILEPFLQNLKNTLLTNEYFEINTIIYYNDDIQSVFNKTYNVLFANDTGVHSVYNDIITEYKTTHPNMDIIINDLKTLRDSVNILYDNFSPQTSMINQDKTVKSYIKQFTDLLKYKEYFDYYSAINYTITINDVRQLKHYINTLPNKIPMPNSIRDIIIKNNEVKPTGLPDIQGPIPIIRSKQIFRDGNTE